MGCQAYWFVWLGDVHTSPCMAIHPCTFIYPPYTSMFPICHETMGACVHPICHGTLEGHLYIGTSVRHFCVLVHPFAPQFIMVILVAHYHCGSLLYWTGCLSMYTQLHVVLFIVVFSWCLKLLPPQLWPLDPYSFYDCCVLWYVISPHNCYHGPILDGASSNIRSAWCGSATTPDIEGF